MTRQRSVWRGALPAAVAAIILLAGAGAASAETAPAVDEVLNRAYAARQTSPASAVALFRQALAMDPDRLDARKDLAYLLLEMGEPEEALAEFEEVLARDPEDEAVQLQVAFILADFGRRHQAYGAFERLHDADDPDTRRQARIATINLQGWRWADDGNPWFAEVDFEAWAGSRRDLGVQSLRIITGFKLGGALDLDAYLSLRQYQASGADISILPSPFSEKSTTLALGARARPFGTEKVLVFIEVGSAVAETAPGRKRGDTRGGLAYYDDTRPPVRVPEHTIYPWDRSAETYAEVVYFSRFDDNVILFIRHREGKRALETAGSYVDVYLFGQGFADINGEFSNNLLELGLGAKFYPDKRAFWNIWVEGLRGVYIGRRNRDPLLLGPNYGDLRYGITAYLVF